MVGCGVYYNIAHYKTIGKLDARARKGVLVGLYVAVFRFDVCVRAW